MNKAEYVEDLVDAGFLRLDADAIDARPPRISWGILYRKMTDEEKISYLERLAASMNKAAATIQEERDKFGRLCELKEMHILELTRRLNANNQMLQQQVTSMNESRQALNAEMARLNGEVRRLTAELEATRNGDHD